MSESVTESNEVVVAHRVPGTVADAKSMRFCGLSPTARAVERDVAVVGEVDGDNVMRGEVAEEHDRTRRLTRVDVDADAEPKKYESILIDISDEYFTTFYLFKQVWLDYGISENFFTRE